MCFAVVNYYHNSLTDHKLNLHRYSLKKLSFATLKVLIIVLIKLVKLGPVLIQTKIIVFFNISLMCARKSPKRILD